jgi:hypothetical protein
MRALVCSSLPAVGALLLGATLGVACRERAARPPPPPVTAAPGDVAAPGAANAPAHASVTDLDTLPVRAPRWQLQLDDARGLELVAHPPMVVADRIVVAGSRIGWVGLALDGTVQWRHAGSPRLAAPLVRGDALVLLDECGSATAVDPGQTVLACATWIGARDGQRRRVVPVRAADASACVAEPGGWRLTATGDQALLARGTCRFAVELGDGPSAGFARRLADARPAPDDQPDLIYLDPELPPWQRKLIVGRSMVINPAGDRILPGLTVLADDAGAAGLRPPATLVRRDASLRRDALIADRWWWPLPDPGADRGRGGPVAVASTAAGVVAFFDGDRVALFAP